MMLTPTTDRFIPQKAAKEFRMQYEINDENTFINYDSDMNLLRYRNILASSILSSENLPLIINSPKIKFKNEHSASPNKKSTKAKIKENYSNLFEIDDFEIIKGGFSKKLPEKPYKVLDAPGLENDFYLNQLDVAKNDLLSAALGGKVYILNLTNDTKPICLNYKFESKVTSLSFSNCCSFLSIGTDKGRVSIWDTLTQKLVHEFDTIQSKIGCMNWNSNLLTCGYKKGNIVSYDSRNKDLGIHFAKSHKLEVCCIRWSPDKQYIATGGNDNKIFLWHSNNPQVPIMKFSSHKAAVKAISWSNTRHAMFASGGGTADKTIKLWDCNTLKEMKSENTNSQVCNILFSRNDDELVATHGFPDNEITLWQTKSDNLQQVGLLKGHTERVLYLLQGKSDENIITGSGDETIRFWKIFSPHVTNDPISSFLIPAKIDLR